jgi:CcmD family protein
MIYLFAAYSAIWILLFGYIFGLSQRQRRVQEDLAQVQERLGQEKRS